jgi:serine/threonine protein kinase
MVPLLRVIADERPSKGDARPAPAISIGLLPQEPVLDESKTVLANVRDRAADTDAFLACYTGITNRRAEDYSDELIAELSLPQEQLDHPDAFDYSYGQGLLDRDVKPANIMITNPDDEADRRVLLGDFGIARSADDINGLTATNMTVGTVAYAGPEQLMGEDIDARADQYALAATAYQLLTGSQLFPHSNPAVMISRHLNASPHAVSLLRPDLAALDAVLAKALSKDPADR